MALTLPSRVAGAAPPGPASVPDGFLPKGIAKCPRARARLRGDRRAAHLRRSNLFHNAARAESRAQQGARKGDWEADRARCGKARIDEIARPCQNVYLPERAALFERAARWHTVTCSAVTAGGMARR